MSSSPSSPHLSSALTARFIAAQERHQRLKLSLSNGPNTPTTPPGSTAPEASPSTSSLSSGRLSKADDLLERLARLATTEPPEGRPPLETYTTTPSAHGDIYRATDEFRRWLRSRYPGYGVGDHSSVRPLGSVASSLGGTPGGLSGSAKQSPLDRFKTTAP